VNVPADLAGLVEEAAYVLACRGWWESADEDEDYIPDWLAEELTLIAGWPCTVCADQHQVCRTGYDVADHFLALRQETWERSWPAWTCTCGRVYKVLAGGNLTEDFYEVADDSWFSLPGDRIGGVRRNAKGKVKHSDRCPGCGMAFADVIAEQSDPLFQYKLF
jgi:hypothetical protein